MSINIKKALLLGGTGLVTASLATMILLPQTPNGEVAIATLEEGVVARKNAQTPANGFADVRSIRATKETAPAAVAGKSAQGLMQRASPPNFAISRQAEPMMTQSDVMVLPAPYPPQINPDMVAPEMQGSDRFPQVAESEMKQVGDAPISTFSVDVDTASYTTLRSYLMSGRVPDREAVRIEEMINYFQYDYTAPTDVEAPFSVDVANFETPWNTGTEIVRIGLQGMMPDIDERPPLDIVFLIDTSGSMRAQNKLGLLKQSLRMMLSEMREGDRIGIVTYAGSAGVRLEMTSATERDAIEAALDGLVAGGSTAGAAGLQAAYDLLEVSEDRIGRVILATDGDFNVGLSGVDEMKTFIEKKKEGGAYLSVLGFGQGNYNDALMQTLAQNGNGMAAYIDTLSEAQKVLVDQLTGTLFTIANDVKVQVEFNPDEISEYRLIGYETRALKREDFKNDKVDAGDIGAGHQVTALYEVTPVGSVSDIYEPRRYGPDTTFGPDTRAEAGEIGFLRLRYKRPGESESNLIEVPISAEREIMTQGDAFATAIAGWGQHLKGGRYIGDWSLEEMEKLARNGIGEDPFGYRAEALRLMKIYGTLSR